MPETLTYSRTLKMTECWCGLVFAIPSNLLKSAHDDGLTIHCPIGHNMHWRESEADRLKKTLAIETQRAEFWRLEEEKRTKELRTTRGQLTKTRKRAANGVCPCCKRSFVQLARHMAGQHPDFAESIA